MFRSRNLIILHLLVVQQKLWYNRNMDSALVHLRMWYNRNMIILHLFRLRLGCNKNMIILLLFVLGNCTTET